MKKNRQAVPTPGFALNKKQMRVVSRELSAIAARRECIKPQFVVDAARPVDSPLHPFFTWDDARAGDLWREREARELIRSVRIVRDGKEEPIELRKYINVSARAGESRFRGSAYLDADEIRKDDEYRMQAINDALAELKIWRAKYDDFKEFFSVYLEIDSAQRNIEASQKARRVAT